MYSQNELQNFNRAGVKIFSGGTTGKPKKIFRSPENLVRCNIIANEAQKITRHSKIYTVCDMGHAGGMLAQTLPGIGIGASVEIEPFNAYKWCKKIKNYTHSHLTPGQAIAIMLTKNSKTLDLTNIWITCGSDRVTYSIIEWFIDRNASFLANWGMSEVMIVYPLAWVFFVPFILITSFAVLNLFIGIIVDAMQQQNSDNGQEQSNTLLEELVKTQQTVNALRQDINRIKKRLEN